MEACHITSNGDNIESSKFCIPVLFASRYGPMQNCVGHIFSMCAPYQMLGGYASEMPIPAKMAHFIIIPQLRPENVSAYNFMHCVTDVVDRYHSITKTMTAVWPNKAIVPFVGFGLFQKFSCISWSRGPSKRAPVILKPFVMSGAHPLTKSAIRCLTSINRAAHRISNMDSSSRQWASVALPSMIMEATPPAALYWLATSFNRTYFAVSHFDLLRIV